MGDFRRIELGRKRILINLLHFRFLPAAHTQDHEALQFHGGFILFQFRAQPGVKVGLFREFPGDSAGVLPGKGEDFHPHEAFLGQEILFGFLFRSEIHHRRLIGRKRGDGFSSGAGRLGRSGQRADEVESSKEEDG